jgi:hypothetical protein
MKIFIFTFSFHDDGGRIVEIKSFSEVDYKTAYEKATKHAESNNFSGVTYCDRKGKPLNVPPNYIKEKYGL